jgi:deoxycytidine triphosphate deaminase
MLRRSQITARLNPATRGFKKDPFFIVPCPAVLKPFVANKKRTISGKKREKKLDGAASIDLRLGTWFLTTRRTRVPTLEISEFSALEQRLRRYGRAKKLDEEAQKALEAALLPKVRDTQVVQSEHVRFGQDFILHPGRFVLGVTLEWFRLPSDLGGYVTGRSSWGRRGLIIATATGVHPGFTGCLTLELANLGDIPIAIRPGMTSGQLFLHDIHRVRKQQRSTKVHLPASVGRDRGIRPDEVAALLADVEM